MRKATPGCAPLRGAWDHWFGRALQGLGKRPYVFTKCSLLDDGTRHIRHSLKRDSILREAEGSLRRLGVDAIDLYQIHWPIPDEDIEEGWSAMAELKERGLVRRDRLLPDGLGPADRGHQPGADCGDWRKADPRFTEPQLSRHLALAARLQAVAARLQAVAARHGSTPGAVAAAWTLRNPAVDGAIAGFRRPAQVDPVLDAAASSSPART
jgi:aryl-alcohol dehydrogenase-like predicted oxidoreductase